MSYETFQCERHGCPVAALSPSQAAELGVTFGCGAGPSGKDTVKKAIADAYDLAQLGETRPFMLVLSHPMTGLLGGMITRARRAGVINDVVIIGAQFDGPAGR